MKVGDIVKMGMRSYRVVKIDYKASIVTVRGRDEFLHPVRFEHIEEYYPPTMPYRKSR